MLFFQVQLSSNITPKNFNNEMHLVGVILALGGNYVRSHAFSTGEDFNSLIVAVFLSKQLKIVWLRLRVIDLRRKRLRCTVYFAFTWNNSGVKNGRGFSLP